MNLKLCSSDLQRFQPAEVRTTTTQVFNITQKVSKTVIHLKKVEGQRGPQV